MKITFSASAQTNDAKLVARIINGADLPDDLEPAVKQGAKAARFTGKAGQQFDAFTERAGHVVRIGLAGVKSADKGVAAYEKAGAALAAKYLTSGETTLSLDAAKSGLDAAQTVAVLTGISLRSWRHDAYRTKLTKAQKISLKDVTVHNAPDGTQAAWAEAMAVIKGVKLTRELVAEPGNVIYPESFVERCKEHFAGTGAIIETLDEKEMAALGMGALLGVSQGSVKEGRLLIIRWNGGNAGDKPTVFVGKGVTFDTGGISIKPAGGMEDMKWDMGGAGAVAGAMLAISGRKAKANVIGVCGLVENMPDGNAQRPGDVVTTMSGQTVEVINTDAEGRLVLGDALTWVQETLDPKVVVDLATLTGAIIVALGHEYGGMYSNDDDLAAQLDAAGKASGDKLWRMPLSAGYDRLINSPIADMKNVGGRWAGSITAAQYLQRYINKGMVWAHLDIAGMAWADKAGATWDKGATGFGARLLDTYVRDNVEG